MSRLKKMYIECFVSLLLIHYLSNMPAANLKSSQRVKFHSQLLLVLINDNVTYNQLYYSARVIG